MLGVVDDRVAFAAISFRSSSSTETPNGKSHPLFNLLTDLKDRLAARAPAEIGSFYFTDLLSTGGGFTWSVVSSSPQQFDSLRTDRLPVLEKEPEKCLTAKSLLFSLRFAIESDEADWAGWGWRMRW